MKKTVAGLSFAIALLIFCTAPLLAQNPAAGYHSPAELEQALESLAKQNKSTARLHRLAKTPGGRELLLFELGTKNSKNPAILVAANMEGNCPPASEAALRLAELLLGDWAEETKSFTWFILPVGNPDGYANYFDKPLAGNFLNARSVNKDNDDATDEDGPEDLNGDGYITRMRQAHPEGRWQAIADNPVLLKRAKAGKGESGTYRLFGEGIDNDGDGRINEDGPGGVNPGRNFPHDFQHFTKTDGRWAASEVESRAVLKFAFDHPEIALVLTFGRTNSLKAVPEGSKKSAAASDKYKLPKRWAKRMGVDPEKEFPMPELLAMARDFTGWKDLTEDMVLQFLGVGAAVNPHQKDVPYWKEISEHYNEFIKEAGLDGKRLDPPGFSSGSIEEWAYFQYGVPSFSMDFWTVPIEEKEEKKDDAGLTLEKIEKMSSEEFIAFGEEKIAAFLKESGAPSQYTAAMVIKGLEGGMMTTARMAKMLRKMKKKKEAGGADETEQAVYDYNPELFVGWQPFNHPTLGEVEIGGQVPYADLAPPVGELDSLLPRQLPFVRELTKLLPQIEIKKVELEKKSDDVWKVTAWIANTGFLPFPTHQGERCQRPTPAVATLSGNSLNFLEGRSRQVLGLLAGSGGVKEINWLVHSPAGSQLTLRVHSFSAGGQQQTITLSEGGPR